MAILFNCNAKLGGGTTALKIASFYASVVCLDRRAPEAEKSLTSIIQIIGIPIENCLWSGLVGSLKWILILVPHKNFF